MPIFSIAASSITWHLSPTCLAIACARRAISVTERQRYILRVRTLARSIAQAYYASREALGFPMLRESAAEVAS